MRTQQPSSLTSWNGNFTFPADDPIYADHFPHAPVVPGTLIIHAFRQEAERRGWQVTAVRSFRFRHFAVPGSYAFSVTVTESGLRCALLPHAEYHAGGKPLATGELAAICTLRGAEKQQKATTHA
ncbi:hypothetical protein N1030_14105 [Desulfovibrio mangrovi]|uniref:hypothetical protein n=1 Tax=Desulfovibrio mangrovi TaxID=2976983 RepID=UPI002245DE80|nr:hypothetical protein [Desulfovibrio mangrovi]UZP66733.1 hypothetical protein N1030_14105 [Desulfovibrio mangrovi]